MHMLLAVSQILAATDSATINFILWLIAVACVIYGVYTIFVRKLVGWGIALIIIGLLVGPGGVSLF